MTKTEHGWDSTRRRRRRKGGEKKNPRVYSYQLKGHLTQRLVTSAPRNTAR